MSTFNSINEILHKITNTRTLKSIKRLHAHLLVTGLIDIHLSIHSKLIFSYTICPQNKNPLKTIKDCFKCLNPTNPFPFNALLSDYHKNGLTFFAVKTLSFMHSNGVFLDSYSLCSALTASSSIKDVIFGKQMHVHVMKTGFLSSVYVGSALIDLYAKLSSGEDSRKVFDEMPVRNSVCANAVLLGYCEGRCWGEVIELVRLMPELGLECDTFTLSALLRSCVGLVNAEFGRQVHGCLVRKFENVGSDVFVQSSLIEMYGKCGLVWQALRVFEHDQGGERSKDVVLWTSMLGVYGRNGCFSEVIRLFEAMLVSGTEPDSIAFVTVISACGHTGQVELGIKYFESMISDCNINPGPEHYSCLVDLLCRAGELDKAWKLVDEMICKGHGSDSVPMWGTLLSSCYDHGMLELGVLAARKALEIEPKNVGMYVMLSNLYAKFNMWNEIGKLREEMNQKGLKKDIGCSWIEVPS